MEFRAKPYYSIIEFIEKEKSSDSDAKIYAQGTSNLALRIGGGAAAGAVVGGIFGYTLLGAFAGAIFGLGATIVEAEIASYRSWTRDI